jgi:ubiquinone biosynthesis monooxygenase Coq7
MPGLLDAAYRLFLGVRRIWRSEDRPLPWPAVTIGDLRSDHAGEAGAVQIYRGILAVTRNPGLRSFAEQHLRTEEEHLRVVLSHLPPAHRGRLLPTWRVAGWLTGALPALFGPRAVYSTIAAVETFVDVHYAEQIARLDAMPPDPRRALLRADLEQCRTDEIHHRDEARQSGTASGLPVRLWTLAVGRGSAAAVALARRF